MISPSAGLALHGVAAAPALQSTITAWTPACSSDPAVIASASKRVSGDNPYTS